jgi:hypothetical protein
VRGTPEPPVRGTSWGFWASCGGEGLSAEVFKDVWLWTQSQAIQSGPLSLHFREITGKFWKIDQLDRCKGRFCSMYKGLKA